MVESLLIQRVAVLLLFLHVIFCVESISYNEAKTIETILETMKIETRLNVTRYRLVENAMRQHLINNKNDVSTIHLIIHPKANRRVIDAVAKICSQHRPTVLWTNEKRPKHQSCNRMETCFRVNQIIGIYSNIDDVNPDQLKNSYGNAWNSRSKILVLVTQMTSEHEDSIDRARLEQTLENFWSLDCLNVALMTMPGFEKNYTVVTEPRIFSYDPFTLQIGKSDKRGRLFERSVGKTFFPEKLNDLQGYSIPISMYHQEPHAVLLNYTELGSGIYVSILRYLSVWLNFTVDLKSAPIAASSYKILLPDGNEVGPIGDIIKNRSDYLANPIFLSGLLKKRLEYVRPIDRAHIAFLVPRGEPMPGIVRVFRSIDTHLAIVVFICWILLACYFMAIKKRYPFLKTYRLFIHQQLRGISKKSADRIFSISWIIWAFVLSTAFQSHLKKDLTDPPFYKSIDTLKELESSPLTLMADPIYIDHLNQSASRTKVVLSKSAIPELDFSRCTKQLVDHRDVACAMDEFFIKDVARKLNKKYSKNQWRSGIAHIATEYLTDDWRTIVVKEGFPYLDKFNIGLERMRESGLTQKWASDDMVEHFQEGPAPDAHFKLNMSHFEGTFYILLIGEGTALGVFIGEIIFHYLKRRFQRFRNRQRALKLNEKKSISKYVK